MLVWCPWMGVQLPKIVRVSSPLPPPTQHHTVPAVSTEGGTRWTQSWLAQLARGNSQSFHLLPEKSAAQTQWGFFWLWCDCLLSDN